MNKEKFKNHLNDSARLLLALNKQYCLNELSENCVFIITPNVRIPGEHLNAIEVLVLNNLNKRNGKPVGADEVVELLNYNEKVPLWINMSVFASAPTATVVELICSRRLRGESELNSKDVQYPPFRLSVIQPPDFLRTGNNGKYDINWNGHYKDIIRPAGLLVKMKRFITGEC